MKLVAYAIDKKIIIVVCFGRRGLRIGVTNTNKILRVIA